MTTHALMNTYGTRSVTLERGEGCYLWDDHGRRYLDALSGIAVCGLGHSHPAVTDALSSQAGKLLHTSNLFNIPSQEALADKLRAISGLDKVFFCNSGTEANEAALKIARKFGHERGIHHPVVITAHNSFHGRTLGAMSATGNQKIRAGFEPYLNGFIHAPYNSIDALRALLTSNPDVVAIMVEPVQGEGGVVIPDANYLPQLRQLCDEFNILMMLDEIQTGNGRTGHYFAFQGVENAIPDVVTTAKGLGNGVPIGACLARGAAANVLQPGNHGTTFGGNPLCTTAALAVVNTIEAEHLSQQAAQLGQYFLSQLNEKLGSNPKVADIRGQGLMIGIELTEPDNTFVTRALKAGVILNMTAGKTIRLLPPLIMTPPQADIVINTLLQLINP